MSHLLRNEIPNNKQDIRMPAFRLRHAILYFAILSVLTYFPVLSGKKSFFATDITTISLGYRHWAAEVIKRGEIPAWCPDIFTGYPALAESQSGIFYPLFSLFLTFPVEYAYGLFIVLHYFLAALLLYVWLLTRKISSPSALVVATGYFFSSLLINYHVYCNDLSALTWMPLILAVSSFSTIGRTTRFLIAAILFFIQILTGHMQFVWNTILFGLLLDVLTIEDQWKQKLIHILIFWLAAPIAGAALAGIQVLPTLEFLINSQRSGMTYAYATTPSYELRFLAQAFLPNSFGNLGTLTYSVSGPPTIEEMMNVFVGLPNLFFAIIALTSSMTPRRIAFLLITIFGIFLALGNYNPFFSLIYRLPGFSFFRYPNRYLVLATFSVLLLSGYGMDAVLTRGISSKKIGAVIILFIAGILISWHFSYPVFTQRILQEKAQLLSDTRKQDLILACIAAFALACVCYSARFRKWYYLLFLSIMGGAIFGYRLPPTMDRSELASIPDTVKILKKLPEGRIDSYYEPYIEDNIYSPDRSLAQKYQRMKELICGDLPLRWGLSSIRGMYHPLIPTNYYSSVQFGQPWSVPPNVYRLMGLRYFLSDRHIDWSLSNYPLEKLSDINGIQIYRSRFETPRARLVTDWHAASATNNVELDLDRMFLQPASTGDHIDVIRPDNRTVELQVHSAQGGLVVLSDLYYPGWKTFVDEKPAQIYRVNRMFRGAAVLQGDHKVRFYYPTDIVKKGALVSIIAALFLAGGFLAFRKVEKQ